MEGDGIPDEFGLVRRVVVLPEEAAGRVRAVDLEALVARVAMRQPEVVQ
jgi:hypothetical protein